MLSLTLKHWLYLTYFCYDLSEIQDGLKETKSATINIFSEKNILFISFVKAELSYVFTINLFTIAENCMEK